MILDRDSKVADCSDCELILASASPRRKSLLELAGLSFKIVPSLISEDIVFEEDHLKSAERLAEAKARDVALRNSQSLVLAADTIVAVPCSESSAESSDGGQRYQVLGKPADQQEAIGMLNILQGAEHEVVTGYCILCEARNYLVTKSVRTRVWFRELSDKEIQAYVSCGETSDKAGAYAIQGVAGIFVTKIDGSYSNVVGLPLAEVISELEQCGVWKPKLIAGSSTA